MRGDMASLVVLSALVCLVGNAMSDPVGQCDSNRISNQYLRDDRDLCVFYQCEYQGTRLLKPTLHSCAPGTKVPEQYGESAAYPDNSNPCVLRVWNPAECRPQAAWGPWGDWSTCSKSCGSGFSTRSRVCTNGPGCQGADSETTICTNVIPCCPVGFVEFSTSCYSFITASGNSPSWSLSRAICQNSSADLAAIESAEEHQFIKDNLRPITPPNKFVGWYIGGYRPPRNPITGQSWRPADTKEARKQQYYWISTGQRVEYDGWRKEPGVPQDRQPDGSDTCMVVWIGRQDFVNYEFDDYSCTGNVGGYVCEKSLI